MSKSDTASESRGSPANAAVQPDISAPFRTLRFLVFTLMEGLFIILAWYCYSRPPLLPWFDFEPTTIRSGFITIFSLWHTIAISSALHVCCDSFSKEWAARNEKTDAVSTVTSGIIDRIHYLTRPRATKTFKAAFFAFLGLLVIRITGSSTITVASGIGFDESLPIGTITTSSLTQNFTVITNQAFLDRLYQANMIVRLEHLFGAPWGYVPQPGLLIPLPTKDLNLTTRVTYETDIVGFRYNCQWRAPDSYSGDGVTLGNLTWTGDLKTNATSIFSDPTGVESGSSILHLLPAFGNYTGDSVYLFLGGNLTVSPSFNATFNSTSPNSTWIDLSGLPTVFNGDGFAGFSAARVPIRYLRAPLATLLICSPNLSFMSREVRLEPNSNLTEPDIEIPFGTRVPSPHNIDRQAARTLFTTILHTAIRSLDGGVIKPADGFNYNFNWVSVTMLLDMPMSRKQQNRSSIQPLSQWIINDRMDKYTLSALKAFTSGYQGPDSDDSPAQDVFGQQVKAQFTSRKLALSASLQFAVLHSVLFGVLVLMLAVLIYLNKTQLRRSFDLKSLNPRAE